MRRSKLEIIFDAMLAETTLPAHQPEYKFALPDRKWRFDYAWPKKKIAVEVEGGVWSQGRHTRGSGFIEDCIKYNHAALNGWTVLRYTRGTLNQALIDLKKILKRR